MSFFNGNKKPSKEKRIAESRRTTKAAKQKEDRSPETLAQVMDFSNLFPDQAWLRVPYIFISALPSWQEAALLSFIVNRWSYYESKPYYRRTYNGWYYFREKELVDVLKIPKGSQYKILKHLSDLGLIEMERRGVPPRRYIRIRINAVQRFMRENAVEPRSAEYEEPKSSEEQWLESLD